MLIRLLPALSLSLALAACAPVPPPEQAPDAGPSAYFALGTEPGWTLEITAKRLRYHGDYGATKLMVANPGARPSFNGSRYVADRLRVDITHIACNDGMSDRRYADTVTVTADEKTVTGCGGAILPPTDLAGTRWTLVSIGGQPVAPDRPTSVQFDGMMLSGTAGCNRISGRYTSDGKRLTAGPLATTRMACQGAAMAQEQAFLALLAQPVSLRFTTEGRLILVGVGGASAILAPVI